LRDKSKRQTYDLIYHLITQIPRPPPASTPQPRALNEAAQIAALQKSKQERGARWPIKKNAFNSSILELERGIRYLEQEIKNLKSIVAAEAAIEAQKNSWTTWLLSPISKKLEETEEEKVYKDRKRQERRIEKDMKERRLVLKKADLKKEANLLRKAKEEINAADLCDDEKIRVIQARICARESLERQEREKVETERRAKVRKQQQEQWEKWEREAAEAWRKQEAEKRAAEQERQEEKTREWQEIINNDARRYREQYTHLNQPEGSTYQAYTLPCRHDSWWPKVQGRTACPKCYEIWTYLLQCPDCKMKARPRCQATLRSRTNRRTPLRARTPSPAFDYDYGW